MARQQVRKGKCCPECLGLGWVRPSADLPANHPMFGKFVRCPTCMSGRVPDYLRRACGLSGWQAHANFENYIETSKRAGQLQAAKDLLAQGWGWLTYWGGHGKGKSYLLAAIVNEALAARKPATYITAGQLLDHLRDAYKPGGIGYSEAFDQWRNCQVLAIDEASVYHQTSWAEDKYRQLLDYRYNLACDGDGITVFATNLQPHGAEWPDELDWLASRMFQFKVLEAKGGDIRPQIGKQGQVQGAGHWSDEI